MSADASPPPPPPPHRRRVRYRGTHPRGFRERYKELAPEAHPDLVAHVRAGGRTPAGQHVPILVTEVLAALDLHAGARGIDATLGYGGHAAHILPRLAPGGVLLGLDADPIECPKTEARLRAAGHDALALIVRRTNFAGIGAAAMEAGLGGGVDFLFADLGVSSMQLDDPARGFSFRESGPLDMRMNPRRGPPASEWLAKRSALEVRDALRTNADEPFAQRIADAIFAARGELSTTSALARVVRTALAGHAEDDEIESSVQRTFQGIRIEVNDEFGALDALLRQVPALLAPGGRFVALTFHSGEDRRVKQTMRAGLRSGLFAEVSDEPVRAGPAERRDNPRSSSAKLRAAVRSGAR